MKQLPFEKDRCEFFMSASARSEGVSVLLAACLRSNECSAPRLAAAILSLVLCGSDARGREERRDAGSCSHELLIVKNLHLSVSDGAEGTLGASRAGCVTKGFWEICCVVVRVNLAQII